MPHQEICAIAFSIDGLLVVGCWLLIVGCWLLVVGCLLLVVGCLLLVVGCLLLSCHAFKLGISSDQDGRTTRIL